MLIPIEIIRCADNWPQTSSGMAGPVAPCPYPVTHVTTGIRLGTRHLKITNFYCTQHYEKSHKHELDIEEITPQLIADLAVRIEDKREKEQMYLQQLDPFRTETQ